MPPAFEATATLARPFGASGSPPSRWPEWVRRLTVSLRSIPPEAMDRSTGLYNAMGLFAAAGEALQADADVPFSVVIMEFDDLREVYHIYGGRIARQVVAKIVRKLRALAGSRGWAGRTGKAQFTVVLPRASHAKALQRLQRAFGKPPRIEFDTGDSEIVLVPDLLVDEADPGAGVHATYHAISRELARMRKHELRRLNWLAVERERHSRPMSLPTSISSRAS